MRSQCPETTRLVGGGAGELPSVLTVDVEEWYHTCLVPEYVDPLRRPELPTELDRLLPRMLEWLSDLGVRATFFVLGEVAERLPARVEEIAAAGHEVASHGHLHLRANDRTVRHFLGDVARSKAFLEDLLGQPVEGFRAPEWSLRSLENPRLPGLARLGFRYDSSLAPYPGAGSSKNPRWICRIRWSRGEALDEAPPLTFGGRFGIPASGWPARLRSPGRILDAIGRHRRRGGIPVLVVHPWEVSREPTPGVLTGLARFVHEVGRTGFADKVGEILGEERWLPMREALDLATPAAADEPSAPAPVAGEASGGDLPEAVSRFAARIVTARTP